MSQLVRPFIANEFRNVDSGASFVSVNPATEQALARVQQCGEREIHAAVLSARKTHSDGTWAGMAPKARSAFLIRIAEGIRECADQLIEIETADSGKPARDNRLVDIPEAARTFEYFAELVTQFNGRNVSTPSGEYRCQIVREPRGVIASIGAWNFPLVNAAWKIAPAIAVGNCIVFKPAEQAPLSSLRLAQIIRDADVPAGVVNVVTGPGSPTGQLLVQSPGVDMISFTGSTRTGQRVMSAAAENITTVKLELGGKSPNIVLSDCDMDSAVEGAIGAIFTNAGQVCTAGSRLLLHESLYDTFMEKMVSRAAAIRVGDPTDESTEMGPLVSREHYDRVMGYIESALEDGATLVTGGKRPEHLPTGYYLEPTIFENVPDHSRIVHEEVFGPVLTVHRFATEEEAIRMANDTPYGLAAGIWSRETKRAEKLARRIEAGTVWINTYNIAGPAIPFSGFKCSGIGVEMGREGLEEYTRLRNICVGGGPSETTQAGSDTASARNAEAMKG